MNKVYRFDVHGVAGHRQRAAFGHPLSFTRENGTSVAIDTFEVTGTHDFVRLTISAPDYESALAELDGQLSDGIFENCRYGLVEGGLVGENPEVIYPDCSVF